MGSNHFDPTSLTLLEKVRSQHPESWDRLVELYGPLVYHWCSRANLATEDASDVFQEVFQAVAAHINRFQKDHEQGSFRGWLRTIASNKIRDHFRKQAKQAVAQGGTDAQMHLQDLPDPLVDVNESEEETVLQQSLRDALEWVRGDFQPGTWQAFWESQIEGRETLEIAEKLNMTPAAVRKAKYRVLRRLREELQGLIEL